MNEPKVSICCLCYNQKDYIAQTLESMLAQKTDFPFEILIHDDASTDGTADIVRSAAEKYPEIVKPLFETENQFSKDIKNISGIYNFPRAKGRYIAMCEGDDYWCDETKLQRQADYMDAHPECSLCFHSAYRQTEHGLRPDGIMRPYGCDRVVSPEEIIDKKAGYPTASLMLRTELMQTLPDFYMQAPIGDIPMQLTMALGGSGYYMDRPMAVYRYRAAGSWTAEMYSQKNADRQRQYAKDMARMYDAFDAYSEGKYHEAVTSARNRLLFGTMVNARDWQGIYDDRYRKYYDEMKASDRAALRLEKAFPKTCQWLKKTIAK